MGIRRSFRRRIYQMFLMAMTILTLTNIIAMTVIVTLLFNRYEAKQRQDQAHDWAEIVAALYLNHRNWHTLKESEHHLVVDGHSLNQVNFNIISGSKVVLQNYPVIPDSSDQMYLQGWETAPIVVNGHTIGVFRLKPYVTASVSLAEHRAILWAEGIFFASTLLVSVAIVVVTTRMFGRMLEEIQSLSGMALEFTRERSGDDDPVVSSKSDSVFENVVNSTYEEFSELFQTFQIMHASLVWAERTRKKRISEFLHEVHAPMSLMLNRLEAAQLGMEPMDETLLQQLQSQLLKLNHVLDDVGMINSPLTGVHLDVTREDICKIIEGAVELFSLEAKRRAVRIEMALPKLVWVHCDVNRIHQVLVNLISNAVRHTGGGGFVRISAHEASSADRVSITIEDSGLGISEDVLSRVFERFYTSDRSDQGFWKGAGLGLAICKEIVQAHGGEIDIKSRVNVGTEVRMILPKAPKILDTQDLEQ